jgi:hypothetical protein
VPNDHSKCRTCGVLTFSTAPVHVERDDGGAGIHSPHALAGKAFNLDGRGGEEDLDRAGRIGRCYPGDDDLPLGRFEAQGIEPSSGRCAGAGRHRRPSRAIVLDFRASQSHRQGPGQLKNFHHINSAWERGVQPIPHLICGAWRSEGEFEVFSLARSSRRRSPNIRNSQVRREAS